MMDHGWFAIMDGSIEKYREVLGSGGEYREVQGSTGKYKEVQGSTRKYWDSGWNWETG